MAGGEYGERPPECNELQIYTVVAKIVFYTEWNIKLKSDIDLINYFLLYFWREKYNT